MKKLLTLAICVLLSCSAMAQKYVPQITNGTVLNYTAYLRAFDRSMPAVLTITELKAPMQIKWYLAAMGSGVFEISEKALLTGTKIGIKQPGFDPVTKLKDDETLAFLSKATFNTLITTKAFELNKQKFTVQPDTTAFLINGKEADTFYAISDNGKTKIRILNNPDFPLICKLEGARQGIDLTLDSIQ